MSKTEEEPIPGAEYAGDINSDELYADEGEGDEQYAEGEDPELEDMKRRVQEMEEEQEKLTKLQQQVEKQINSAVDSIDENSVYVKSVLYNSVICLGRYVGQVDYEATIDDLRGHFAPCGTIKRVTILCDKFTGHAKGCAEMQSQYLCKKY